MLWYPSWDLCGFSEWSVWSCNPLSTRARTVIGLTWACTGCIAMSCWVCWLLMLLTCPALFSRWPHPTFSTDLLDIQVSILYTCLSSWEKPTKLSKSQMRHYKGHNLDLTSPSCSGRCRASIPPLIEACQCTCMGVESEWSRQRCCPSPNWYHATASWRSLPSPVCWGIALRKTTHNPACSHHWCLRPVEHQQFPKILQRSPEHCRALQSTKVLGDRCPSSEIFQFSRDIFILQRFIYTLEHNRQR